LLAESTGTSSISASWYIDSGATTHATSDINTLSTFSPYNGPETVYIGNGIGLEIAHKGSSLLLTTLKPLTLTNVLHVPEITKNLLSVSQLTLDNGTLIEFSSNSYFIKDKQTNQILLHGILNNDLYNILSPQHQ
jgi:hypothetical protein